MQMFDVFDGHFDDFRFFYPTSAFFQVIWGYQVRQIGQTTVHSISSTLFNDFVRQRILKIQIFFEKLDQIFPDFETNIWRNLQIFRKLNFDYFWIRFSYKKLAHEWFTSPPVEFGRFLLAESSVICCLAACLHPSQSYWSPHVLLSCWACFLSRLWSIL